MPNIDLNPTDTFDIKNFEGFLRADSPHPTHIWGPVTGWVKVEEVDADWLKEVKKYENATNRETQCLTLISTSMPK